jgi:putative Mn2+ efflux pump MntP
LSRRDPTRGWSLVVLSVATSIDALAIGITLGVLGVGIWVPSAVIGVITAGIAMVGIRIGACLGARFGSKLELAGGLLLISIGIKILVTG